MGASRPSPEGGKLLRAERVRVRLSTREVERMSREIASEKKNQEYYISHGWLTDAENGAYVPGAFKLYTLSVIYKRRYEEILGFFGIHVSDIGREQMSLTLPRTHLIGGQPQIPGLTLEISAEMREKYDTGKTNLVSRMFGQWGGIPVSLFGGEFQDKSVYGYIGTEDYTLFPLIRPGPLCRLMPIKRRSIGPAGEMRSTARSIS